jgi:hypothetical protein
MLECGDSVRHTVFGEGEVCGTELNGGKLLALDVTFVCHGRKTFVWGECYFRFERLSARVDFSAPIRETKALEDVIQERVRQEKKWGPQNHDPFLYLTILGEEYGETCQAALEARFSEHNKKALEELREEAVQTAAVALAIVECLDRKKWAWGSHAEEK